MKPIILLRGSILTRFSLLTLILFFNSCKKDDDLVIPESHANAIWMISGEPKPDTLTSIADAGGTYGVAFWDLNNSFSLYMRSISEYYHLVIDPDFGNLVELKGPYYRFTMTQSKQTVKDFNLSPTATNMEKGSITIGIDQVDYKSESGTMHVEKCEDQNGTYILTYDSKGTFSGQFYDVKKPNIKRQISGTWNIDLF